MEPIRSVEDLVEVVMDRVKTRFYHGRPAREWATDRNALLKAVMRYGYECTQRGWRFETEVLAVRLLNLLNDIHRPKGDGWFPVYLENAVDLHVRERAEEIQAAAAHTEAVLAKVRAGLPVTTEARPPVASELAAAVFCELKRRQHEKAEQRRLDRDSRAVEPELFGQGSQRRREGAKGAAR